MGCVQSHHVEADNEDYGPEEGFTGSQRATSVATAAGVSVAGERLGASEEDTAEESEDSLDKGDKTTGALGEAPEAKQLVSEDKRRAEVLWKLEEPDMTNLLEPDSDEKLWRVEFISELLGRDFVAEIQAIAQNADVFHREKKISSVMWVNVDTKMVYQVIVGPMWETKMLWNRILHDRRHIVKRILSEGETTKHVANRYGLVQATKKGFRSALDTIEAVEEDETEMSVTNDHFWVVEYESQLLTKESIADEIAGITAKAQEANNGFQISGYLTCSDDGVVRQMIEGHKEELLALWGRIQKDPRHKITAVLQNQATNTRVCRMWGMTQITEQDFEKKQELAKKEKMLTVSLKDIFKQK